MIIEIGHFSLILAFLVAVLTIFLAMVSSAYRWSNWAKLTCSLVLATFFLISISFFALIYGFVVSDFSLVVVFNNSHSSKPLFYKLVGTWGNHEGSMLLLSLIHI